MEPERVVLTLTLPGEPQSTNAEVMTAEFEDLGGGRSRMTFTQRGRNLPANEYSRAMRGSLIFFERLADHVSKELKARHDAEIDASQDWKRGLIDRRTTRVFDTSARGYRVQVAGLPPWWGKGRRGTMPACRAASRNRAPAVG